MRRRITWRSAAAISMLGLAPGIGAAFAGPAGASTKACATAYGTQCGTFTAVAYNAHRQGGASGGLGWDVKGQHSVANTPLIEYPNYSPGTDPGTDLTKVEHYGAIPGSRSASPGIWYSIVFTPSGRWTSMCVSNPDNRGPGGTNLVLRSCNQQKWQAFMYVKPTPPHHQQQLKASRPQQQNVLPPAPSAPRWDTSKVIPNASSTEAYALYSVANGRFVEVTRPRMSSAAGPGPGPQPRALSASGRTGDRLNPHDTTNTWFWTNAKGTGTHHMSRP